MKPDTFWRSVVLALVISVVVAMVNGVLAQLVDRGTALRLSIVLASMFHVGALLASSPIRSGRVLAVLAWLALTGLLWMFDPPLGSWLLMITAFSWLLRSLQRYESLLSAGLDGLISAFSMVAAISAALHSHSLFLSLWCYFLVQSLHVCVPQRSADREPASGSDRDFDASLRSAETALRQLTTRG